MSDAMEFGRPFREVLPAPELLTTFSMPGLELFQLTTNPEYQTHVPYYPRRAFSYDSRYLLLCRDKPGTNKVLLCDLENDFLLTALNEEDHCAGALFAPDGEHVYYSVPAPGRLSIRRVSIPDLEVKTVAGLEGPLPTSGVGLNDATDLVRLGGRLGISHDGKRLFATFFTDDPKYRSVALAIFDTDTWEMQRDFVLGPRFWNSKTDYAPCFGPDGEYLLCVSDCYSNSGFDGDGKWFCHSVSDQGGTRLLIDEQGQVKMAYPVGRDRPHQNVSHHAWFGSSLAQVFHADTFDTAPHYRGCIMYAEPVPATEETRELGRHMPGGKQIDMTRYITRPDVCHLGTNPAGTRMACDTIGYHDGMESYVYVGTIKHDEDGPFIDPAFLVHPKSSWKPYWCECIPGLSPDANQVAFNSDYPGANGYAGERHTPQAFLARGHSFPP